MRHLMWFRSDLRTADNRALYHACRDKPSRGVIALYVICPGQWRDHDESPPKIDLILRTLRELSASLAKLNIPLLVRRVEQRLDVPQAVATLARELACDAVFINREYEVNESRRDAQTERLLAGDSRRLFAFTDQVILPPDSIRTGENSFYTVFSPFKRSWLKRLEVDESAAVVPIPKPQAKLDIAPDDVPPGVSGFESSIPPETWPAGEAHAMRVLHDFVEHRIQKYKTDRNVPGTDGTSRLSPYLANGSISPRQCLHAAREANAGKADGGSPDIAHWISEIVWREFYVHILVGFPRVCMNRAFRLQTEQLRYNQDPSAFKAWSQGRTGFPIVDAAMRQMHATGWMHNRVRMIAAMFLTKNLFIDFREGERFFMRHLVDGFFASNNGGWQWSSSTGTDAAPYFRIFNPVSQSRNFDPDGSFIRAFVPELRTIEGDAIHAPWELPPMARARLDYPEPIVDLSKSRAAAIAAFQALTGERLPTRPYDDV
ncbi:MAG: deoxyribodipyrimidine photo-lyase [Planctomycetota bacterium]|nr:deoxyribodipyrimidine photo-lyase [Planctomycetota bacterium]